MDIYSNGVIGMAKILIFSDLHLHNWSYGATYEGPWNSRLLDQKKVGDQIVALAQEHKCDVVVFCGDLFHTHGRVEAGPLKIASELFSNLRNGNRKVFCLVGNHDLGRETNSVDWLRGQGVRVVDDFAIDLELGLGFVAFADNKPQLTQRLNALKEHKLKYWFLHQGVQSVPVGSDFVIPNEIFGPDDLPSDDVFYHAFTGHYHNHRRVGNITTIGSPMQFNWSDHGEARGCIIVDTVWKDSYVFHKLKAPFFVELDGLLNISPYPIGYDVKTVENAFVRIKDEVSITFMEDIRKKLMEGGARSVEFTFKKPLPTIGVVTEETFDLDTLIKRYIKVNEVNDTGVDILNSIRENI